MKIDFCSDVGSSFGKYRIGEDEEVMKYITSANIDCGWHAGDPVVMDRTVNLAMQNDVNVGAHPGFPDPLGFGQRNMDCTQNEIIQYILYQLGALQAFCTANKTSLTHVKPAGNLYLMAAEHKDVAEACAEAIFRFDPNLVFVTLAGQKGDMMSEIGKKASLRVAREFFADREYTSEGTLVSRRLPGSLITDAVHSAERVLMVLEENRLIASDGTTLHIKANTICIHSFQSGSAAMARSIREILERNSVTFEAMDRLV